MAKDTETFYLMQMRYYYIATRPDSDAERELRKNGDECYTKVGFVQERQ